MATEKDDSTAREPAASYGGLGTAATGMGHAGIHWVPLNGEEHAVAARVLVKAAGTQLNLPKEELEDVEDVLSELTPLVLKLTRERRRAIREALLQQFVDGLRPSRVDMQRADLRARALQAVLTGSEWLTAQEIAQLGGVHVGSVHRWRVHPRARIFSLRHEGRELFPRYALEDDYTAPRAAIAKVMAILADDSPQSLAAWFESPSSFLGGQRPRELIASEPARVIEAARDSVQSIEYAG